MLEHEASEHGCCVESGFIRWRRYNDAEEVGTCPIITIQIFHACTVRTHIENKLIIVYILYTPVQGENDNFERIDFFLFVDDTDMVLNPEVQILDLF